MKKIICLILSVLFILSLASCGAGGKETGKETGLYNPDDYPEDSSGSNSGRDVIYSASFQIDASATADLTLISKNSDGYLSVIKAVINGSEEHQYDVCEITSELMSSDKGAFSDSEIFNLMTRDINFDGFCDFAVQSRTESDGRIPYLCFIWDDTEQDFKFCYEIEDPVFDEEKGLIYCTVSDNGEEYLSVNKPLKFQLNMLSSSSVSMNPSFISDLSAYEQYMNPADRDAYLLLVNKDHPLDETFIPEDLIDVVNTRSDREPRQMCRCAEMALEALYTEMAANGYTDVSVTSAYRSYTEQDELFNGYLNQNLANGYDYDTAWAMVASDTALPGTSEHQSGLCCDMHNQVSASNNFANEDVYRWLCDNAWKFGFILRFPAEKEDITKYSYESWHYRFVGRYHAARIHALDMCLEEYLDYIK